METKTMGELTSPRNNFEKPDSRQLGKGIEHFPHTAVVQNNPPVLGACSGRYNAKHVDGYRQRVGQ